MADEKDMAAVETSVVNPKQAVNVMENLDKVTSYSTPTFTLQTNPEQFKQQETTSFFDSEAWKDYKSDLLRAYKNKYPAFSSIEAVSQKDVWRDALGSNSDFVVKRAQAIHSAYTYSDDWFGKLREAYNAQRYGLRSAVARKDLSDAIREGDELKIAEAKIKYEQEQKNVYERGHEYEEYGNTLMSLAASSARNPETIPINIAGILAAGPTGGASIPLAQLINAGIVGLDTYNLETGSALQQLDELDADLTEEQKFQKARITGAVNALVEAGAFGFGGNLAARGAKSIGGAIGRYGLEKIAKQATGKEITKEASKSLLKTQFIKALQNPEKKTIKDIIKQASKDTAFGSITEGGQEVFQDSMADAMLRSVQNGTTVSEELLDDWVDFFTDPFGSQHAQKWETFANVALASPVFAGAFNVVGGGIDIARTRRSERGVSGAVERARGAINNNLGLSNLFAIQGEVNAKNGTPVSNAVLQEQIRRGEVSGKLYTTVDQVNKMLEDPEVAEALEAMGVAEGLENAAENGGVVELDFGEYDRIVNQAQNQTLFQKMRNYLSFSETTMTIEEYNQFVRDSGKQISKSILEDVRKDTNSIFNKAREMFIKAGMQEAEAEGNAAIIHTMLTNAKEFTQDKKNDILDRVRVTIEGKDGGNIVQKFNEAMAASEVAADGSRTVNMGDQKQTAISFNKIAKGKNKGKYTIGIKDNTGLSSVMKDTGNWSTPEEKKITPAVFDSEDLAKQAVETMYTKTEGDGVSLDVGAAFNEVFAKNPKDDTKVYRMFVGTGADLSALPQGFQDRIQKAKDMMAEGKSKEEVFKETHLHIAPDGKLRIQISDVDAQLTEDSDKILRWDSFGELHGKSCELEDIFDHELLFELYPGLRKLPVYFKGSNTYMSGFGYMNIGSTQSKSRIRQSILHELQHAIQEKEDWAQDGNYIESVIKRQDFNDRANLIKKVAPKITSSGVITYWHASEGGNKDMYYYDTINPDEMRALIESPALDQLTKEDAEFAADIEEIKKLNKKLEAFDSALAEIKYYRLFGEAEPRMTERLSYMTQEQLDTINPYDYFDVTKFLIKDRLGNIIQENIEAPKNKQKTGEFNVVFDPESGRSIIDGTLREAGKTVARNGQYNIVLTPNANATTFAHEIFHMFSLELQRVYNNGTISDYWKKQAEKMFKLADVPDIVDGYVELTEAQEERLANMFTTYIMKGNIENREIRGILAKLIEMFKVVYQQAESRALTEKALNKKAYDFFNAVVSSQDTIEEIQRNAGLLEIAEPEGVDRELYDYYIANLAISKVEASEDLRKKLFAIDSFRKSDEYTKLLQQYKDEATAALAESTRYRIAAQANLFSEDNKVSQTTLLAQNEFPELELTEKDITDILNDTKPLEQAATEQANEEMENYIASKYALTREELGFKEERNRAKVRALLAESVMRRGGTIKDIEEEIKKAENASDKHLAKTSVYQIIELDKWKNREAATVQRYTWAKNNDREDLMSAERFNQAVLNLIMIKSNGFKSEYQKLSNLFEKLQDRQKKYQRKDVDTGLPYGPQEHRYHAEDWELLRSISEKFGNVIRDKRRSTKTVHEQMKDWIKTQVDNRFTTVAGLEEYLTFIDRGHDGSIGSMNGKNFKKLWAVIGTINAVALREQQLFLDGEYAELAKFVGQTVEFYQKMGIDTEGKTVFGTSGKFLGKYGTWTNPEPLAKAIFPPEVFRKIFLPMFQGATLSESVARQWIDRWNKAKKNIDLSTKEFVLDDGTRITYGSETQKVMSYADVANLLLAMGAEHSYENYKLKFGLTDEQATMIASQAIKRNKNYINFMNETWAVYGIATEKLNTSFQERNNELFVEKQHRAFDIDGIHFEGGYVPEDKHYQALVRELGTWNQGTTRKKKWKNEEILTKAADGDVLSIVDITETKLSQSAKWIYAAIPYNNLKKFLENKTVSDTIGKNIFRFFRDWLQNWDTPHFDESGMWRPLSRMTTLAALGMRASTALLQVSGLVQTFARLGPVYTARGMLQFIREGGWYKPFKIQEEKSVYMTSRVENPFANKFGVDMGGANFKEIFDKYNAKNAISKIGAATLSAYQRIGMSMIQLVDGWVATMNWNGAYQRAIDNGLSDEEARLEADSEVRITQSDAMQISRSTAMQEPWARAVTAFGTWTMGMRSQTQALRSSKNYRPEMVAWTLSWVVVASFLEAFLKDITEPADDGDEDKEMLERITNSWYNKIVEAVGTQILPFAGLGSTGLKMVARGLESEEDEKIFKVYAGGNVSALQYALRIAESTEKFIDYMQTGEEEQRDKFFIAASNLISNNLKKHVKIMLEDN